MTHCNDSDLIIDQTHPSPNCSQRIFFLVLHYTALDFEKSLKVLTDPKKQVSAHYLVPETEMDKERKIFQLVQEEQRAQHAGVSTWQKRTNLNDTSIGIEIVNLGYKDEAGKRIWYPFTDYQIQSVIELTKIIVERYQILPTHVVGHSDIAPNRKVDPGPLFPWKKLYENGIGAWFDEKKLKIRKNTIDIKKLQINLQTYGYGIDVTGQLDAQTRIVLQAFQMHFRPNNYSGNADAETVAILENLLEKYFPSKE
ncbi:MAG: N-acetylmuramoyl-L-alanine amidase [Pseudomonadota bacterium]